MSNQIALFIDFENVALWAEKEFIDFELTSLMDYLKGRGPVVIKRAYGDWGRFSRYREEMMNNAIDLTQLYSVRAGKNRADIRMALDALEVAIQREQIGTFAIVSGDSDFGPLINKLRTYGRYTLGIGPRDVTHPLLIKACDEFVYLEGILDELSQGLYDPTVQLDGARQLLEQALRVHEGRGELPISTAKLKQTMVLMDPTFNEANLGFSQFKNWLEHNSDLVTLYVKEMQVHVAPKHFRLDPEIEMQAMEVSPLAVSSQGAQVALPLGTYENGSAGPSLRVQYQQIFSRLRMTSTDFTTRRDVLRDIYRELSENPNERTTDELLEMLCTRYEEQGLIRSKTTLRQIWQMGFRQRAFVYEGDAASVHVPVRLSDEIEGEAHFVRCAESGFVYAVINAGLEIDRAELALVLLNDQSQTDYIDSLLDDLERREIIVCRDGRYRLPGEGTIPFFDEPILQPVCYDIEQTTLPDSFTPTAEKARQLAKTAMYERSQDFAASSRSYLSACRIQWEAVEAGMPGATLEDLRWYMASYASVRAGELSQIHRDYAKSRPYYLAFFYLVQEDNPLWSRMRGLINPMLSYYWINAWRELNISSENPSASSTTPADIAVRAAHHDNQSLCGLWFNMTSNLAQVNSGLVRRVANQIRLANGDSPLYIQAAEALEQMVMD